MARNAKADQPIPDLDRPWIHDLNLDLATADSIAEHANHGVVGNWKRIADEDEPIGPAECGRSLAPDLLHGRLTQPLGLQRRWWHDEKLVTRKPFVAKFIVGVPWLSEHPG